MKQVYGFSAGLRGNTPDNQLISTSGKSDTDTDAGIKLNSPVGGSIILGCSTNDQCQTWAADSVCDTVNGDCECPSGFKRDTSTTPPKCVPTLQACFVRYKDSGIVKQNGILP